ncbi:Piwi-domain-containing protein [Annulohypoxylon maeteangense]|uniref:Piwi-domain-containing protein n=1 Tax=Annulohypoxylon maeteangense TaxID=1927788 RepID=UPI002008821A|nr:Piwi-domain-containing protein [Annulohypoxylon maeteangense]KAI0886460.1 Piwi-domain-containing protein [Annulohypoxylon maeteangense]
MSDRPPGSSRGTPSGSQAGSKSGSRAGSSAASSKGSPKPGSPKPGSPGKSSGKAAGTGLDPALERKPLTDTQLLGKRFDLPPDAYIDGKGKTHWAARPGFCTMGKPIKMGLNIFPVITFGDMDIYQYDVIVSPNLKNSHSLVKKVWNAQTVTDALQKQGGRWLYDGSKLAWSSERIAGGETRIIVDLDALKKKAEAEHDMVKKKVEKNSVYKLTIRQTKAIRLSYLKNYLSGTTPWDTHVLECMNFFDHCLRQWPSQRWMLIKRNFFDPNSDFSMLANDVLAAQGIYCAPRLSESFNRGGSGLAVNVDRCQTAFWPAGTLIETACNIVSSQRDDWNGRSEHQIEALLRPRSEKDKNGIWRILPSEAFMFLRRMIKLKFTVNHRGKFGEPREYTIKRVMFDPKYGTTGANANQVTFMKKGDDGTEKEITIVDHYKERWGFRLEWPRFPIIETPQGHKFPMELCNLVFHQRYNFKLNPTQTADMIKRAATRPNKRREDIMEGIKGIRWPEDQNLKAFGLKIDPNMVSTDARLLQNPEVKFANKKINPGTTGRWDLRSKMFLEPNAQPLKSWSFICCGDDTHSPRKNELEAFATSFSQTYRNHGGRVEKAAFCSTIPWGDGNMGAICEKAWNQTGNYFKATPQIIFFVLPTKNQLQYERLKKNMECRFCIVTQCLQAGHVKKNNAQYMSNVAMKVNSKLGGVTCKVPGPQDKVPPFWNVPTMMVGVDVSHAAAGSQQPSMAALTMSMDKHATRFAAACQTNGWRQETVLPGTMNNMMPKLLNHWVSINGRRLDHVYYLRDGVSEGQFQDVIDSEVKEMKRIIKDLGYGTPKFTVIIATKRHHVRFFPKAGDNTAQDRNGNPLPGTLVERDVTHPQHWDWYLCSHVAIQGTARPVHYQVILDEAGVKPNDLMKMIYQQCYQYCRSTTPVSLHPAVYYAHLASNRGRAHEALVSENLILGYGKPGFPYSQDNSDIYRPSAAQGQCPPLLPMENHTASRDMVRFLNTTMWYV